MARFTSFGPCSASQLWEVGSENLPKFGRLHPRKLTSFTNRALLAM